jgi:hypothetical protein
MTVRKPSGVTWTMGGPKVPSGMVLVGDVDGTERLVSLEQAKLGETGSPIRHDE